MAGPSHYQILRRIGDRRFLARQSSIAGFARSVVLERLPTEVARDPQALLAARLDHPNLVSTYELLRRRGQLFAVTEHVDGLALEQLMAVVSGPLPLSHALHIACGVAAGLQMLHEQRLAHGAVSPARVLVSAAGDVKLAGAGRPRATEQDRAGDRLALGRLLLAMTTGRSERTSAQRFPRGYPDDLRRVVLRAISQDGGRGFRDCQALHDALSRLLTAHGVVISSARLGRFVDAARRHAPQRAVRRRRRPPTTGSISAAVGEVLASPASRRRVWLPLFAALLGAGFAVGWRLQQLVVQPPPRPVAARPVAAVPALVPVAEPLPPGWQPDAGLTATVGFRLRRGLEVELDGRALGRSPLDPVEVGAGRHRVTVVDPRGDGRWEAQFSIARGQTRWISF